MPTFSENFGKITPHIGALPKPEKNTTPERVDSILLPGPFYVSRGDIPKIENMIKEDTTRTGKIEPTLGSVCIKILTNKNI